MPARRKSYGLAGGGVRFALALALAAGILVSAPSSGSAVENGAMTQEAVGTTATAVTTEAFLPYSDSANGKPASIPGSDGEQYLVLILAAVFFFLGLGYRLLARISDVDRRT